MLKRKGFTLPEVLVSILIIALVAIASYTGFYAITGVVTSSRNRLNAFTLSQAALEEVKALAKDQNNFNNLAAVVGGLPTTDQRYLGFTRNFNVITQGNLRRVDVNITWQDRDVVAGTTQREHHTTILLSEPPVAFPANIFGVVTNSANSNVRINSATITITKVLNPTANITTSSGNITNCSHTNHNNGNGSYHFCDTGGNFLVDPGRWNLQVSRDGYYTSNEIHVWPPELMSNEDRRVDVSLVPSDPGRIIGRFVRADNPTKVVTLNNEVYLHEAGVQRGRTNNGAGGFSFTINFTSQTLRRFTVSTLNAWKVRYCGNFCGPIGQFHPNGWSSSVVTPAGINCSNSWQGNASTDRIEVNPGETINLGDIPLFPVPLVTLSGIVFDTADPPNRIDGATIDVRWNVWEDAWGTTNSVNDGSYAIAIPAAQALFPNNSNYYVRVRAYKGNLPVVGCCNQTTTTTVYDPASGYYNLGATFVGDIKTRNFSLAAEAPDKQCGKAHGLVQNGKTLANINGAQVKIGGYGPAITIDGAYAFACLDPTFYPIVVGQYTVEVTKNSGSPTCHAYSSGGNWVYRRQGTGKITIIHNGNREFNVKLWPYEYGTIRGRVVSGNPPTYYPVSNVMVKLRLYSACGNNCSTSDWCCKIVYTGTDGRFVFTDTNAPVSLPPQGIRLMNPSNPDYNYYTRDSRLHRLYVESPSATYLSYERPDSIQLDEGQDLDLGDIVLPVNPGI